jgi:hypothetical protein
MWWKKPKKIENRPVILQYYEIQCVAGKDREKIQIEEEQVKEQ